MLDEISGELGLVLWQSLRDAMLWGRAGKTEREALFAPGADRARTAEVMTANAPEELEEPLRTLAGLLGSAATAREEIIALACRQVAQWAEDKGLLAAALAFAQAAAVVNPADPPTAYAVGRLARLRGELARAETWFRRTIALARQAGDWPTYALAFNGMGNVYSARGNFPSARRSHHRALRAAGRNSLHEIAGAVYHDLFGLEVQAGDSRAAHEYARTAFQEYGPHHARIPVLVADVAFFWTTEGECERALSVLRSLEDHFEDPPTRTLIYADIGRAAGGAGDRETFHRAWDAVSELIRQNPITDFVAGRSYLDLAYGALSLGLWERADDAAQRAQDLARRCSDGKTLLDAEGLQQNARHRQRSEVGRAAGRAEWSNEADALATEFVLSLTS